MSFCFFMCGGRRVVQRLGETRPDVTVTRTMAITLLIGAAAVPVAAQQPEPQTFRSGVDVVQVDVSVLDKRRLPVEGLAAADFSVREDGKARPIVAFAAVRLPAAPTGATPAAWLREMAPDVATNDVPREGRLVVIMFDWSIRFNDQQLARRIATAAVDQLGPGDLAAVVFTSGFGNAGTPQNFTADRTRLLAAINQPFALALHNPPVGPGHDPRNGNEVMIDDPEGYESGDCLCRVCVAEAITRVADVVRNVPERRKMLLFIGTYFRSYEALQGPMSRPRPGPSAAITGAVRPTPQQMNCSAYLKDAREKMRRAASLANLTIHTLDPVGLETSLNSPMGGSAVGIQERQADLRVPADLTGGRTIMNTAAPEAAIPTLFAESSSYYLLAFTPADPGPNGKLHSIEVKVNRPGISVRTRSGYYAADMRIGDRAALTLSPEAADAIQGVLPRRDVPLAIAVAPFAMAPPAVPNVAIVLGVRQPLSAESAGPAPVKVLVAAFDRNGRAVQSETQTIGFTRQSDSPGVVPYEILSVLPLKPGRYEVRAEVDAGSDQRGSVFTFVDVPDFARDPVSMSGIVLAVAPPALVASNSASANLLPVVPTAKRTFAPTDRVTAFVRVNEPAGPPAEPVTVVVTVKDAQDRIVAANRTALAAGALMESRGADYRFELPVDRLKPGEHVLTIEAVRGSQTVRRSARFFVE
jgi:VWFA-related protein